MNKKYESVLPDYTTHTSDFLTEWVKEVNTLLTEYNESFTAVKIRASLATAMRIASLGNKLLQANTLDNKTFAAEPEKIAAVIGHAVNLLHLLVAIFRPFMPDVSASMARQIGCDVSDILIPDEFKVGVVPVGQKIGQAERLFEPIKPEKEEEWRDAYGGEELRKMKAEKAAKAEKKRLDKLRKKEKKAAGASAAPAEGEASTVQKLAEKVEELRT